MREYMPRPVETEYERVRPPFNPADLHTLAETEQTPPSQEFTREETEQLQKHLENPTGRLFVRAMMECMQIAKQTDGGKGILAHKMDVLVNRMGEYSAPHHEEYQPRNPRR